MQFNFASLPNTLGSNFSSSFSDIIALQNDLQTQILNILNQITRQLSKFSFRDRNMKGCNKSGPYDVLYVKLQSHAVYTSSCSSLSQWNEQPNRETKFNHSPKYN